MSNMDLFIPGFETGVHTDARSIITTDNQASVTVEASAAHSGSYGTKWNPAVGNQTLTLKARVNGQTSDYIPSGRGTHTFSIWLRTSLAQGDHTLALRLRAYNTSGVMLQETVFEPTASIPVTAAWQQFTVTQEPVNNTAYIQPIVDIDLATDLNNASFYLDDMVLDRTLEAVYSIPGQFTNMTEVLRLEVQKARNDAFVWGISTWTGYRWGGASDTPESGVEWLNILGETHDIKVRRGGKRDGISTELEVGSLTATVFDAAVDPNTNPYIKPGTPMRLQADTAFGTYSVFTGVINNVRVSYRGAKPTVFLAAVDRVKDMSNISRSGVIAGTFAERVDDLLGKHGIPFEVTGGTDVDLAQNAFDSSLSNHMDLAARSGRGRWFVDKDNAVKAYGMNASPVGATVVRLTDERVTAEMESAPQVTNLHTNPSFENGIGDWNYTPMNAEYRNLVTNPTFELGTQGWAPRIGTYIGQSQTQVDSGSFSMRMWAPSEDPYTADYLAAEMANIPIAEGEFFHKAHARFWLPAYFTDSIVRLGIDWYTAADVYLTSELDDLGASATGAWFSHSFVGEAPLTAAKATLWVEVTNGTLPGNIPDGTEVYIDNVGLINYPTVNYFDGDTPSTDDYTYSWEGTPHNSASKEVSTYAETHPSSAQARSGSGSMAVNTEDYDYVSGPMIDVVAGEQYTVSWWMYVPTGTSPDVEWNSYIDWYDTGGWLSDTGGEAFHPALADDFPVYDEWFRQTITGVAPVGAVALSIGLEMGYYFSGTDVPIIYVDDTMANEGGTAHDYFDGDNGGYWTGAPNASTSILNPSSYVEYTDIVAEYDSANMANDIYINNLTYGFDEEMNPVSVNTKYGPFRNSTSIATFGAYTKEVDTNLPNEIDVEDFAADILDANDEPELRIERVRFNASAQIHKAASLEVSDLVNVEYTNPAFHIDDTFRVLAVEHTISAEPNTHKWLVDVDLISKEDI